MTGPSPSLGTPMRQPLMITALAAAMAVPATISAQGGAESTAGGRCTVAAGTGPAPSAAVYRLTPSCLRDLRLALNAGEFGRALEIYFGESYNPALANWEIGRAHV